MGTPPNARVRQGALLDPDEAGNAHLRRLVDQLDPVDQAKFVKRLTRQCLEEKFHTYRELLVGARLRALEFNVRYERRLEAKTPDWTVVDENGEPIELLDVVTLHQKAEKELEIRQGLRRTSAVRSAARGIRSIGAWITVPHDHVYAKLSEKAGQYAKVASTKRIPFVIAMYSDWLASVSAEELKYVLFEHHDGWFKQYPEVSGVIHFAPAPWVRFSFRYTAFKNPASDVRPSLMLDKIAAMSDQTIWYPST